jgi:paraquat-inducible protein A
MTDSFLACRDCGQLHSTEPGLSPRRSLSCRRCGARLWRRSGARLTVLLALMMTAVVLFGLANSFPLFEISLAGSRRGGSIAGGALALTGYGGAISPVGVLVAMIAVVIPALSLALVLITLARLALSARDVRRGRRGRAASVAGFWRVALRLRPWSMLDVYLLGAVVAYTRLDQLEGVRVGIAAGGYALSALVLAQILIEQLLAPQRVWNAIGDPAEYGPAPGEAWVFCRECELVVGLRAADGGWHGRCPRCAARLAPRRPGSLAATAAFIAAGYILYVPANLLPVLTIIRFGQVEPYTILGGVRDLATAGLWPLALLVLVASIIVPALKLVGLTWCLVALRLRAAWLLRQRTVFYRFINFIGRWSNIDVFVVSILVVLVQFGNLTTIEPGPGIAYFAGVVLLTMVATRVFDPRLMWDAAAGRCR